MTIQIAREETRCRLIGYSFRLTARVLLYAPSHRQDNTYHGLCYSSRGALAGTRNSSMGPPHEGSTRTLLPRSYISLPAALVLDHFHEDLYQEVYIDRSVNNETCHALLRFLLGEDYLDLVASLISLRKRCPWGSFHKAILFLLSS